MTGMFGHPNGAISVCGVSNARRRGARVPQTVTLLQLTTGGRVRRKLRIISESFVNLAASGGRSPELFKRSAAATKRATAPPRRGARQNYETSPRHCREARDFTRGDDRRGWLTTIMEGLSLHVRRAPRRNWQR